MPVGPDQGASTFYTGKAEEAHPAPAASDVQISVSLLAISHHRISIALRDSFISCESPTICMSLNGRFCFCFTVRPAESGVWNGNQIPV
ncbi:hypothetical protein FZC80_06625 [Rossellomorea aquimaris]|uniref:Uncharacterized protein n=1 Tax=Rossellomorea aquimaris TaxID=189382 RepID=A0A5D4U0H1_9BACI|nr:hypothetical protein FZC80_06625 [Rossellomorea aquimaris]